MSVLNVSDYDDGSIVNIVEESLGPILNDKIVIGELIFDGLNSLIFRAKNQHTNKDLAIKLCLLSRRGEVSPDAAGLQFDALTKAYGQMNRGSFRVPEPIALVRELGICVMEWVPGRPLLQLVRDRRISDRVIMNGLARAGALLRFFHSCHRSGASSIDVNLVLDQLDRELHGAGDAFRHRRQIRNACLLLKDSADTAKRHQFTKTVLHGDCKASNIILNDSAYLIDLHLINTDVYLHDLGQLINDFEINWLASGMLRFSISSKVFVSAFTDAYKEDDIFPTTALLWLRVNQLMRLWGKMHGTQATGLKNVGLDLVMAHMLRRCRRALMSSLGERDKGRGSHTMI